MVRTESTGDARASARVMAWQPARGRTRSRHGSGKGGGVTEQQRPAQDLFTTSDFVRRGAMVLALISLALVLLLATRFA